jgi:uncharacterized coiled-coil DUF342 family protein
MITKTNNEPIADLTDAELLDAIAKLADDDAQGDELEEEQRDQLQEQYDELEEERDELQGEVRRTRRGAR